jgi:ADP-ribose pyrophosphatase YjhB (NUDIX family)
MKLFINDKSVKVKKLDGQINPKDYNIILNGSDEILSKKMVGNVLVKNASHVQLDRLFKLLEIKKLKKLDSITFDVFDQKLTEEFIKDQFKIIRAAGGIVRKGDKILMIYRLKKWDLPKGKLDKGEDNKEGAKREVEEECNIKVAAKDKICSTWHSYIRQGKRILKKTDWFEMECLNDSNMKPQLKEDIEEVKWMDKKEARKVLANSYKSIDQVLKKYFKD